MLQVDDSNFEKEVLKSKGFILVKFGADWCGYCNVLAPVIEDLANEYAGSLKFAECDIDKSQHHAAALGFQGVPTVILFKDGKPICDPIIGARPKSEYQTLIKQNLFKSKL